MFITRSGHEKDRSNIWRELKQLAVSAGVETEKVFPHNFRHMFARIFYRVTGNLLQLADILGHSSIETTRRYTMITSEEACAKDLELGQVQREEGGSEGKKGNMEQKGKIKDPSAS